MRPRVLLVLFSLFAGGAGDTLRACRTNVCENGGTCSLMSPTPLYTKCPFSHHYFDNSCYNVVRDALNRSDAVDYCNRHLLPAQAGGLLSIEAEAERRFVADLLQRNVAAESRAYLSIGFWTSGRSIGQYQSRVDWYWQNTTTPMTRHYWEKGEPQFEDEDLNNLCIVVDADSGFLSWKSSSCSDLNFFVCENSALDQNEENWLTQCQCPPGFFGKYCEIESEPDTFRIEGFLCEQREFEKLCPDGGVILVDYALYGHWAGENSEMCPVNATETNTPTTEMEMEPKTDFECIETSSLLSLIQKCQGLTYCRFGKLSDLFPQRPCPADVPISLEYRMRCSHASQIPTQCPPEAIYSQGRCFQPQLATEPHRLMTYAEAKGECGLQGGDLASPQRDSVFSMLFSAIEKAANASNVPLEGARFWVRNDSTASASGPGWAELCPALTVRESTPNPTNCQTRMHWICEFPPTGDQTVRKTESISNSTTTSTSSPETTTSTTTTTTTNTPSTTEEETTTPTSTTTTTPWISPSGTSDRGVFCPEITWLGIRFPETPACQDAVLECPNPEETTGIVTFTCGCDHGTWQNAPDLSNCSHKWVGELNEAILRRDNSVKIAESMFANLRTNVAEQKLFGGDISLVVTAGEQLVPLAHSQLGQMNDVNTKILFAKNFTNLLGNSGDQLLAEFAVPAWNQLKPVQKVLKASNLMNVLELSLALLSENMPAGESNLRFSNWVSRVQTKMPGTAAAAAPANQFSPPSVHRLAAAPPRPAMAPPRTFNKPFRPYSEPTVVEFDNYTDAPVMQLPNIDILSVQVQATNSPFIGGNSGLGGSTASTFQFAGNPVPAAAPAAPFAADGRFGNPVEPGPTKLGYFMYNTIGGLLATNESSIINSRVIGAFVNDPMQSVQLPENAPVNFTFFHIRKAGVMNPRCVFWDTLAMEWSQRGCRLLETNREATKCSCTHLTSFAILMDVNANFDMLMGGNQVALDLITIFGCSLSIVCLIMTILVFSLFRSLYNVRHTIHRNLCLCLLVAELLFVIGIERTSPAAACRGVAIALHYFFLAAFCWMLLEGYQLYMMLIQVFEPNRSRIWLYYLVGYGLPAVIVAISAGSTWQNYGTYTYCWINVRTSTIWAFIIPIIVIIVSNIIVLLIALKVVLSVKSRDRTTSQRVFGWLKGSATLLCLLGITWVFGFMAAIPGAQYVFAYLFVIFNCLQGVFIFVLHVLMNDKVRTVLTRAMRRNLCCGPDTPTSSLGYSSAKTGQTFFSRQRLLHFFKGDYPADSDSSHHGTESTGTKQPSPALFPRTAITPHTELKVPPPPPQLHQTSTNSDRVVEWHSEVVRAEQDRGVPEQELPSPDYPGANRPAHKDLLRIDSALQSRHSAPVKRKKFPLGSTTEQRSAELRGEVPVQSGRRAADIIVEKL